jgi:dihydropteroate synthase
MAVSMPRIMGVVNVTPDSFSDGGRFLAASQARDHGLGLLDTGADWLDIGGESTRPGAQPVSEQEELDRVIPVIEAIRAVVDAPLSVDTSTPAVARAAQAAGASLWNDVRALTRPDALECAARLNMKLCLMHMQGTPTTMQAQPDYDDVVGEVIEYLLSRVAACEIAGLKRSHIWVDPGIGFGKTLTHNLALLNAIQRIERETGCAVLIGASRKSLIAMIDASAEKPDQRLAGSLAIALHAAAQGAHVLRVHDVAETRQALLVQAALLGARD